MNPGRFIVIDGPDGSGKGTQTKLLVERLRREGVAAEHLAFPHYGNPETFFIENYLRGEYGSLHDIGPYAASTFFAMERFHWAPKIRALLASGTTIICDRYVSASKGHQAALIPDPKERKTFIDWLNRLEYGIYRIPKPDLTILLHVPADIAYILIEKKDERGYLDGKKRDIIEANHPHLHAAEITYLEMLTLDTEEHWQKIECTEEGKLLSIEEIHERLYRRVIA